MSGLDLINQSCHSKRGNKCLIIISLYFLGKKSIPNLRFDVRFHLCPSTKVTKTQDNKSILIELENEGWKFTCEDYEINIDNGIYFANKNAYTENQNIFISGITNSQSNNIMWELSKI